MQVTRSADYAVRVMTHLAMRPAGSRATVLQLALESGSPPALTAKILQRLVASGLVVSRRGHEGGFELACPASRISMLAIVSAIEGRMCLNDCLPGGRGCDRKTWCAAHPVWASAQAALAGVLAAQSLEQLAVASNRNRTQLETANVQA